jgi:hypothetical protein
MDDELADLEKEFDKNERAKQSNPLGNSITKEILQQSKKGIIDGFSLDEDDYFQDKKKASADEDFFQEKKKATVPKKNLEIEIDDNADFDQQDNQANQNLNNKLMKQGSPSPPGMGGYEEEEIEMT